MTVRRVYREPTLAEEIASAVTHGVGVALAITALIVLLVRATLHGEARHVVSCAIFGAMLVVLYTASTLYHSIPHPRAKNVLRVMDHSAIYLLIAGTYTPFCLVSLRGGWGFTLLAIIWNAAILGVVLGIVAKRRRGVITAVLSAIMGWAAIVAIKPLMATVAPGGIALIIAGGLTYTAGIAFYGWQRLPYNHAVWHLFVLGGSVLHFFAVLLYVVPRG